MSFFTWCKRLVGIEPEEVAPVHPPTPPRYPAPPAQSQSGWFDPARPIPPFPVEPTSVTAAEVLRRVAELQRTRAAWPEIWAVLNPDDDSAVQRLLIELRGPHLFTPHVALNVLEVGCRRAVDLNAGASRLDALQAALRSSGPFSGYD